MADKITRESINHSPWWTSLSPVAMAILDFLLEQWLPRQAALPIAIVTVLLLLMFLQYRRYDKWLILLVLAIGLPLMVY